MNTMFIYGGKTGHNYILIKDVDVKNEGRDPVLAV